MSTKKIWSVSPNRDLHSVEISAVARTLGLLEPTAVLLYNRGLTTPDKAERFLRRDEIMFHDPFLLDGMKEACLRIESALAAGERIVIYGDYDVDGVTSVSSLLLYLQSRGADAGYYIPNRSGEGYGINSAALRQLSGEGCSLLITVDTGITAVDEIEEARALGMDVIITDHHECPARLPRAVAVVNPKRAGSRYPFAELAGVGVVFKLLSALEYRLRCQDPARGESADQSAGGSGECADEDACENSDWLRRLCENYIDLAALGTVADVMPLIDENRLIVSLGLRFIEETKRPGLAALLRLAGVTPSPGARGAAAKRKRITSSLIGYVIAPRINAAGRISCASKAVELFLTDSHETANSIASELCEINLERQSEENSIIEQTYEKIEREHNFNDDCVIVLDENDWHHGVIGIVSSRITEHYNMPSILISFDGSDGGDKPCGDKPCEDKPCGDKPCGDKPCRDIGKGSGRSIKGLNLVEALNNCSDLLVKFGGHELAAGLSIERGCLPEFRRRINEYAREQLSGGDLSVSTAVDCELTPPEITLRQANELYLLEPYGILNPVPVFVLRGARISELSPIGAGKHTKLMLEDDGGTGQLTAIYFGVPPAGLDFYPGDTCDIIFNLSINDYMGSQSAQLIVRGIDGSEEYKAERRRERLLYEDIKEGRGRAAGLDYIPTRDDFAAVYLYIKHQIRLGNSTLSLQKICRHFEGLRPINAVMLRFIIDILRETNILGVEGAEAESPDSSFKPAAKIVASGGADLYSFKINPLTDKVNLEKSNIYKRLRSRQEK